MERRTTGNVVILTIFILFITVFSRGTISKEVDPILIIHGGAGTISKPKEEAKKIGMIHSIRTGFQVLLDSDNAMDAVEAAIKVMDDLAAFNSGYGSVLTNTGEIEMDSVIINGTDLSSGGVGAMKHVLHPISVARLVLNSTPHVLLVGEFAEKFAASKGIPLVPTSELISNQTQNADNLTLKPSAKRKKRDSHDDVGTVGAVAINSKGQIVAGTSTGGKTGKMEGRVGDSPLIGLGTLADDEIGGISCTGDGEAFMRYCVASKVAQLITEGLSPTQAIHRVLQGMERRIPGSSGGVIAISKEGKVGYQWNSDQMAWAYVKKSEMDIHYGVNRGEDFIEPLGKSFFN